MSDHESKMSDKLRLIHQPLEKPECDINLFLDFYNLRLQIECLMEPGRLILDTAFKFQSDLEKGNYLEKLEKELSDRGLNVFGVTACQMDSAWLITDEYPEDSYIIKEDRDRTTVWAAKLKLRFQDQKKLEKFFEKYTDVALAKTKEEYEQKQQALDDLLGLADIYTLGGYEWSEDNLSWWKSDDFQTFLYDYKYMARIVEDTLSKQEISYSAYLWLSKLGEYFTPKLGLRASGNSEHDYKTSYSYPSHWHCLRLSELGNSVYRGLLQMLEGKITVKKCEAINCDKLWVISNRGKGPQRKWCGGSCRVKGYRKKNKSQNEING